MSLFHPLLAIVVKRDSLERVLPGVQLCSVPPRCQAGAETGAGGQEGGGLLLPCPGRWQGLRVTALIGKSVAAGVFVVGRLSLFSWLCFACSLRERRLSKEISIPMENGCENEKLICKGQPEQGAGLTFMLFRSSSELLLCYAQWRNFICMAQSHFVYTVLTFFFFFPGYSICLIPLWAELL